MKRKRKISHRGSDSSRVFEESNTECPRTNVIKPDIYYGMTKTNDHEYEIWTHEDCIVWSSGVHIIGARVVGLDAAVWSSVRHQCACCKQFGAVLSCLNRACKEEIHFPCAKKFKWTLDEQNFQCRCNLHSLEPADTIEKTSIVK